jgi:hypothetical protein
MIRSPFASLFLATMLIAPMGLAAGDALAPEDLFGRAIARDAYGPIATKLEATDLTLMAQGGEPLAGGRLLLVKPGDKLALRAVIEEPAPFAATIPAGQTLRQTTHQELVWESSHDGVKLTGSGSGSVLLSIDQGAQGYATVSVRSGELQVQRPGAGGFSPDEEVPARLLKGDVGCNLLIGIPFDRKGNGILNGVNVGIYSNEAGEKAPASVRDRAELYQPPAAFYALDDSSSSGTITNFKTLAELNPSPFPTEKQPRMVALSPRLINFLAAFEEGLAAKGMEPGRLQIIRGFLSPTERLRLVAGGESIAEFSRFLYGDAVAVIYSKDGSPRISDLDGDGKVAVEDVQVLADIAKATMDSEKMYGGLGICSSFSGAGAAKGTPYLHIDLRGFYAPFRE